MMLIETEPQWSWSQRSQLHRRVSWWSRCRCWTMRDALAKSEPARLTQVSQESRLEVEPEIEEFQENAWAAERKIAEFPESESVLERRTEEFQESELVLERGTEEFPESELAHSAGWGAIASRCRSRGSCSRT